MNALVFWVLACAQAQMLPRYVDELEDRVRTQIALYIQQADHRAAHVLLEEYSNQIETSEALLYDTALMFNKAQSIEDALSVYAQVLLINSAHRAALYDRSELLLERGELEKAKQDLTKALSVEVNWILHLRLAEIAAEEGDVFTFEQNLMRALASGMQPDQLLKFGEKWYIWSRHPQLGLAIKHVLILDAGAGGEHTWKRLQQPLR